MYKDSAEAQDQVAIDQMAYHQEMTGLHAVKLVHILEKLTARVVLQHILTLLVLISLL